MKKWSPKLKWNSPLNDDAIAVHAALPIVVVAFDTFAIIFAVVIVAAFSIVAIAVEKLEHGGLDRQGSYD